MSRPRPRLNFKSLNVETDTETKFLQVSVSRLRPRLNLHSLNVETETETKSLWVSMSRPRPRLNLQSLNVETETETEFTKVSISRLRPRLNLQPIFTYIYLYLPIFTYIYNLYLPIFTYIYNLYFEIQFMLRPRLIETIKFCGCRDRDSSRLGISVVVETETSRDWTKVVETETSSRVSLISALGCPLRPSKYIFLANLFVDLDLSYISYTNDRQKISKWLANV